MQLEQVLNDYEEAKSVKSRYSKLLDDCYRFFLPASDSNSQQIYDSTGVITLNAFAANLKYSLLPSWRRWFDFRLANSLQNSVGLEKQIESNVTIPMFNAINKSNFDVEVSQSLLELGIGTGALLINEGDLNEPLKFSAVSIKDLVFSEVANGLIENVYRRQSLSLSAAKATYKQVKFSNFSTEKLDLLEATVFDEQEKDYKFYLLDYSNKETLFKTSYKESPWVIFRWSKLPGETIGRGPAMQCLPDIKEANKLKELILQNAVLNVIPTYLVANDGVLNPATVKIRPGGIIPVRNLNAGLPITPLPRGGDFLVGENLLAEARDVVRQTMFYNSLSANYRSSGQSATEIILRTEQLAKDIGASFGRLQTELLNKIIKRVIHILSKKGIIMPIDIDGKELSIIFTSPLARLQDQEDISAIERILPIADRFPEEFRLGLKTEQIPPYLARRSGVSPSLLRDEREKDQLAKITHSLTNSINNQAN